MLTLPDNIKEKIYSEKNPVRKLANILAISDKNLLSTARDFTRVVNTPVLVAEEDTVLAYINHIQDPLNNLSANSIRTKMYNLQKIYSIAMKFGVLAINPVSKLKAIGMIKVPKQKTQRVELNVTKTKRDILLNSSLVSDKTKAIIEFLSSTALRVSEFVNLRTEHCEDYYENVGGTLNKYVKMKIYSTKTKSERVVFMEKAKFNRLEKLLKCANPNKVSGYVVENKSGNKISRQGIDFLIRKYWFEVFGEKMSAHQMRHFFATFKLEETGNIKAVSDMLGHSSIKTTADIYAHTTVKPSGFEIEAEGATDNIIDEDFVIEDVNSEFNEFVIDEKK